MNIQDERRGSSLACLTLESNVKSSVLTHSKLPRPDLRGSAVSSKWSGSPLALEQHPSWTNTRVRAPRLLPAGPPQPGLWIRAGNALARRQRCLTETEPT